MRNSKTVRRRRLRPLESGQTWRVAGLHLKVSMVGKLLVHYKLAKHIAVRVPISIGSIVSIEKFLKKNKAVLIPSPAPTAAKK